MIIWFCEKQTTIGASLMRDLNSKRTRRQCRRVRRRMRGSSVNGFFNLLTGPELFSSVEELLPIYRERLYPPTEALAMFLAQAMDADRSCQNVVNAVAAQRLRYGMQVPGIGTSSFCKARQRIPLTMVSELVRRSGLVARSEMPEGWRWRGRSVKLIDGTSATLADTPANQRAYPQPPGQAVGVGFPKCRILGVVCLGAGSILDAKIGPCEGKGSSEQSMLRELLESFERGDVMVGDALFCTYFLLAELQARGIDGVFEKLGARRRNTDFEQGQQLGRNDHVCHYEKPRTKPDWMSDEAYLAAPMSIAVREVMVSGKVLVTTLLSKSEVPKHALRKLYKSRWHIELDFRHIKSTLGMETLTCKTPDMAEKEIWVYLLAYNLIRMTMAKSALLADVLPRQLSFKHSLQLWRAWRDQSPCLDDVPALALLLELIAKNTVGNRPGRIEPRAVKRRPKPYPLLTTPRGEARAAVRKLGHPSRPNNRRQAAL